MWTIKCGAMGRICVKTAPLPAPFCDKSNEGFSSIIEQKCGIYIPAKYPEGKPDATPAASVSASVVCDVSGPKGAVGPVGRSRPGNRAVVLNVSPFGTSDVSATSRRALTKGNGTCATTQAVGPDGSPRSGAAVFTAGGVASVTAPNGPTSP